MGKLDGKVAVITGGSSGMALAGAKLFVDEGAHVFISGRRQEALDDAVQLIGRNVTGVQADSACLDDLDRLVVPAGVPLFAASGRAVRAAIRRAVRLFVGGSVL
jgi:NAD(P)-dependent dehydrogenase (short-subunit alcohol dehydrogenase family)